MVRAKCGLARRGVVRRPDWLDVNRSAYNAVWGTARSGIRVWRVLEIKPGSVHGGHEVDPPNVKSVEIEQWEAGR